MNKTEVIRLRITPELKRAVEEQARNQNRTISNYLENLILNAIKNGGNEK